MFNSDVTLLNGDSDVSESTADFYFLLRKTPDSYRVDCYRVKDFVRVAFIGFPFKKSEDREEAFRNAEQMFQMLRQMEN